MPNNVKCFVLHAGVEPYLTYCKYTDNFLKKTKIVNYL